MQIDSSAIPFKFTLADAINAMERELSAKGYRRVVGSTLESPLGGVSAALKSNTAGMDTVILFDGVCEPVHEIVYRSDPYEGRGGPGDR